MTTWSRITLISYQYIHVRSYAPALNSQLYFDMQAYLFLFLSVASAVEDSFSGWLTDTDNLGEDNSVDYITTPSSSFEDPFLFANENPDPALFFEDQAPADANSLNYSPWDLFADTSDDCLLPYDVLLNKNRLKKRQETTCAAAKKKTQNPRLGNRPTLPDFETQIQAIDAAGKSNQLYCPPNDHPEAVEAVCSSGDPNEEGRSSVYAGASILVNCERRMPEFFFLFMSHQPNK